MILCANPRAQYLAHKQAIEQAIAQVLEKGIYIKGENCSAFEREFAAFLGVSHGVGVANGTDALRIALSAAGVTPRTREAAPNVAGRAALSRSSISLESPGIAA